MDLVEKDENGKIVNIQHKYTLFSETLNVYLIIIFFFYMTSYDFKRLFINIHQAHKLSPSHISQVLISPKDAVIQTSQSIAM